MSASPIDNLLQVTQPARQVAEVNQHESIDAELFQQHLQRATSTSERAERKPVESLEETDDTPPSSSDNDQNTSTGESTDIEENNDLGEEDTSSHEERQEDEQDDVAFSEEAVLATEVPVDLEETEAIASVEFESIVEVTTSDESGQEQQSPSEITTQVDTNSLAETSEADEATTLETTENDAGPVVQLPNEEVSQDLHQFDAPSEFLSDGNEQGTLAVSASAEPVKQLNEDVELDLKDPNHDEKLEESLSDSESRQIKPATKQNVFQATDVAQEFLPDEATISTGESSAQQATPAESNTPPQNTLPTATTPVGSPTDSPTADSTSSTTTAETDPESTFPVDRARFVQRVSGAFRAAQQRDGEIHLRLSPPELGSLKIEISLKQGVLTAQLETDTSAARNLLLDNLPALRERLAEQDISIEKFDVDVRDEGSQQDPQAQTKDNETNRSQSGQRLNRNQSTKNQENTTEAPPQATTSQTVSESGLDVMI